MFFKIGVLKNFAKFIGKQNLTQDPPMNFVKFLRTHF